MIQSPAKVVAYWLVDIISVGKWPATGNTADDWNVTYHENPGEDDRLWITVLNAGGKVDSRKMRTGEQSRYHAVQILLRASTDDLALAKGLVIVTAMEALYWRTVNVEGLPYLITHLSPKNGPLFLKQEERYNMRDFVINLNARITQE